MTKQEIINIASSTRSYNFHSHTQFCDGRATMAEFAASVAASGMRHYGFSPHSPVPLDSPCNMKMEDVAPYLREVERLRGEYSGRASFYSAMEIDYLGADWGPAHEYFRSLPLDYRIGSVHFIPAQGGELVDVDGRFDSFKAKMSAHFHNDIEWVVRKFYQCTAEMVEAGGFDIIGHFDKIGHNASHFRPGIEEEGWYRALVSSTIDLIADSGLIAEINTKALADHKRFFPNRMWWKEVKRKGIPVVVNSDSHFPELIDAGRAEAFALWEEA